LRSQIEEQDYIVKAENANQDFIEKFFSYSSTKERYENIKPLTTEEGFRATLPSGIEIPEDNGSELSVTSRMDKLKPYIYPSIDKNKVDFMNKFEVSTIFNKIKTTQEIIIYTQVVYDQISGWKVNDVEFVSSLGNGYEQY
jgi:hypothetical protein